MVSGYPPSAVAPAPAAPADGTKRLRDIAPYTTFKDEANRIETPAVFTITGPALERLRADGVATDVLERLTSLAHQAVTDQTTFLERVTATIGPAHTAQHRAALLQHAETLPYRSLAQEDIARRAYQLHQENDRSIAQEAIAWRAYQLYLERGGHQGDALTDWLRAEQELANQLRAEQELADWLCAEQELSESRALEPLEVVPRFPQPMYEPLRDLFPNFLLPGIDTIPTNSIALLTPNLRFIEAYLVGLNHELGRELLWREFPTQLGCTYFRKFWDDRGSAQPAPDIPDIHAWHKPLGQDMAPNRGENLVMLLIRGDLLERYPNALISARRATFAAGGHIPAYTEEGEARHPVLRLTPFPGLTLLGFDLQAPLLNEHQKIPKDDPSWFFIVEEHPTESRFDRRCHPSSSLAILARPDLGPCANGRP
jgi:hypothetical protein